MKEKKLMRTIFSVVYFAAVIVLLPACGNDNNDSTQPAGTGFTISGQIIDMDPAGATIELYGSAGTPIPLTKSEISDDGRFSITIEPTPADDYNILHVSKGDQELRAIISGFAGNADYSGEDTTVSANTEAVYLVCDLPETFRITDYMAFLRSYSNGEYDLTDPLSLRFSFREVITQVAALISEYLQGEVPSKPSFDGLCDLIEERSHFLTPKSDLPPGFENRVSHIRRVLVSSDRKGFLFLNYGIEESTICNEPLSLVSSSHEDGSFQWKEYDVGLACNDLADVSAETNEAKNGEFERTITSSTGSSGQKTLSSGNLSLENASGVFTVSASNVATLIDADNSGIQSVSEDNTKASITLAFKDKVVSETGNMIVEFPSFGGTRTIFPIPQTGGKKTFTYEAVDLSANQNQVFQIKILSNDSEDPVTLFSVCDVIDKTRYVSSAPASPMIASKTMRETRATPGSTTDFYNNYPASNDTEEPVVAGDVYTHYILDFDRIVGYPTVVETWTNTAYGKNPPGDQGGRTPLLIIHGWQGGSKNGAEFGLWSYSPLFYFYNFIEYYLSSKTLQSRYHLYFVRWSSYKHVPFNGQMLTEMLQDVASNLPGSDLARGLTDEETGVVVITHSTGGIVFRSAVETESAFAGAASDFQFLKGAILLASPNHGTSLAFYGGMQEVLSDLGQQYVDTQASADLELDSFDGKTSIGFCPKLDDSKYLVDISIEDDRKTRWDPYVQNCKAYDAHYSSLLPAGTQTFNPWLVVLNNTLGKRTDDLKSRYLLYSGRLSTDLIVPVVANYQSGCHLYQTMNNWDMISLSAAYMANSGYFSDGVLPLASNLFADPGKSNANGIEPSAFNPTFDPFKANLEWICDNGPYDPPPEVAQILKADWYPNSTVFTVMNENSTSFGPKEIELVSMVIGDPKDHPLGMPFRIFWNYSHDNIHSGATKDQKWGQYINESDDLPAGTKFSDLSSLFLSNTVRNGYIQAALTYKDGKNPGTITQMKNPLTQEPVFLVLEKDLTSFGSP